ncbi:MAG: hypothetical protein ACO3A2_05475 [Bdellovibrionia bacterium]
MKLGGNSKIRNSIILRLTIFWLSAFSSLMVCPCAFSGNDGCFNIKSDQKREPSASPLMFLSWTAAVDPDGHFDHILEMINQKLETGWKLSDFELQESCDRAFNHYKRWVLLKDGIPIYGQFIHIWTDLGTDHLIQAEAVLSRPAPPPPPEEPKASFFSSRVLGESLTQCFSGFNKSEKSPVHQLRHQLSREATLSLIRETVQENPNDSSFQEAHWNDVWNGGKVERLIQAQGEKGNHFLRVDLKTQGVVSYQYFLFSQVDTPSEERSHPSQIYPISEEGDTPRAP